MSPPGGGVGAEKQRDSGGEPYDSTQPPSRHRSADRHAARVHVEVCVCAVHQCVSLLSISDFPDPFESPRRSETLSPTATPKLRVYTRNRHPSYPPCQNSTGARPLLAPGPRGSTSRLKVLQTPVGSLSSPVCVGSSQLQSRESTPGEDPLPDSGLRNADCRRHSSPSLSPPPHPPLRQKGGAVPPRILTRPLNSPPPLVPSPAGVPEKTKPLNKDSAQREDDRNRPLTLRTADKGRVSARDQTTKDSERNRSARDPGNGETPAREQERRGLKEPERGRTLFRESERRGPADRNRGSCKEAGRDGDRGRPPSRDPPGRSTERNRDSGKAGEPSPHPKQAPGGPGQSSPPAAIAVLTAQQQRVGSIKPADKSRHRTPPPASVLQADKPSSGKESSGTSCPTLSSFQNARKSTDSSSGPPAAALKPLWPPGTPVEEDAVKQSSVRPGSPGAASAAKEKHLKVKGGAREVSKDREREKTLLNSSRPPLLNNSTKTGSSNAHVPPPTPHNNSNSKAYMLGSSGRAQERVQGEKPAPQAGDRCFSRSRENFTEKMPPQLSSREKKRSVKALVVSPLKVDVKTDPNGTGGGGCASSPCPTVSPAGQGTRRSSRAAPLSSPSASSSDSSESDTQTPTEEEDRDHRDPRDPRGTEDEADGPEDNKHQEDDSDGSGSAQRRYPRRSARARSNMFFGLTPFYGVRSYGEEDLPLYGGDGSGAVGKRRTGSRRKSAEGQVDGADDMSTSSSSGDSGEDEDGGRVKDTYYYNFTRTIINPGEGLPSIEGLDQRLGRGSQLQRFLKDEEEQQRGPKAEDDVLSAL